MGRLLNPRECVRNIYELTPEWFRKRNLSAIICDLDDTLTPYHTTELTPNLRRWIQNIKDEDISICILSNGRARRVYPICKESHVKCVPFAFKPLPFGFNRAFKRLNVTEKGKVAVVGDQIFTDILGGNIAGMYTVLVEPLAIKQSILEKLKRRFEIKFRKCEKSKN